MPTVQQKKKKTRHTVWLVGGALTLTNFFFQVYVYFSFGHSFRGFLKNEIILFIHLFLFLYLLLVIFLGWGLHNHFISLKVFFCFAYAWAFVRVFWRHSWFVFSRCLSGEEIASFPIGSVFGFSWTKMSCQSCSFNYYNCIVQFFENDEKSMEFLHSHDCHLPPM